MFDTLPQSIDEFMTWDWEKIEHHIKHLLSFEIEDEKTADAWLTQYSQLGALLSERFTRLQVATAVNTEDKTAAKAFEDYLDTIYQQLQPYNHALNQHLIASNIVPKGFEVPLRNIRASVELFQEENVPLQAAEQKMGQEYDTILAAQSITWQDKEYTLQQLQPFYQSADRQERETIWHLEKDRRQSDRDKLNDLWKRLLDNRAQQAQNAGFESYRDYMWQAMNRFDYSPQDCLDFHDAIEAVVVPAAKRRYDHRRQVLGVERLRPWDLTVDVQNRAPLRPFTDVKSLKEGCSAVFNHVDPTLGAYFDQMCEQNLLDLDNRKGKAPGGFCTSFDIKRVPFIFMNAVGVHQDVQIMLHESGHAFHVFETQNLPYLEQLLPPMEFAEVASMAMELLAAPYLEKSYGGFYTKAELARARIDNLEDILFFWPYMAVVDAFQHWVYENMDEAKDPNKCDDYWQELWNRFIIGVDWRGFEDYVRTGWHRKLHIFQVPFYYIEYGVAQLGAVQIWQASMKDAEQSLAKYRQALQLGNTVTLPELYEQAGAKFTFDTHTLSEAVRVIEKQIADLEKVS